MPSPLCHSQHWECGLKSLIQNYQMELMKSLPALGVWIEIKYLRDLFSEQKTSLPALGVWIEILND